MEPMAAEKAAAEEVAALEAAAAAVVGVETAKASEPTAAAAAGQKPIHKAWAEKLKKGFAYHGLAKDSPKWEKLKPAWVAANFEATFLEKLRSRPGEPLCIPKGCAEESVPAAGGVTDPRGGIGGSGFTFVVVPSVTFQGNNPFCASYGLSSGLRHIGFPDKADQLEKMAPSIYLCGTNEAAEAVSQVAKMGGFESVLPLPNFRPLQDKSPWPTQIQLYDSEGFNAHVICTVGNWLFNSNWKEAVPLTPENLDAACLGVATFVRCSNAWRVVPGKKLRKELKRKAVARDDSLELGENSSPKRVAC